MNLELDLTHLPPIESKRQRNTKKLVFLIVMISFLQWMQFLGGFFHWTYWASVIFFYFLYWLFNDGVNWYVRKTKTYLWFNRRKFLKISAEKFEFNLSEWTKPTVLVWKDLQKAEFFYDKILFQLKNQTYILLPLETLKQNTDFQLIQNAIQNYIQQYVPTNI